MILLPTLSMVKTKSAVKFGEIYVKDCYYEKYGLKSTDTRLFPLTESPYLWPGCDDAYYYTWTEDPTRRITWLNQENKEKLARSAGFCPHRRCQLDDLQSSSNGKCSPGLCYTKLEKGRPSFGTCCFINGTFNGRDLIGYESKLQPTAKPIYKRNRIVLGSDNTDESKDSFINANLIHKQIIASQCPLTYSSNRYDSTINDLKRMIIENHVSYWISLAPHLTKEEEREKNDFSMFQKLFSGTMEDINNRYCLVFPLMFLQYNETKGISTPPSSYSFSSKSNSSNDMIKITRFIDSNLQGISNFEIEKMKHMPLPYVNMSYTVSAYYRKRFVRNSPNILFGNEFSNFRPRKEIEWEYKSQEVRHIWYYHWKDFVTPPVEDYEALHSILDDSVSTIRNEASTALVTCFSGRGRSGTFSALLASKLEKTNTIDELVNIIVNMRECRDGLIETPEQFEFLVEMLGLDKYMNKSSSEKAYFSSCTIDMVISGCLSFVTIIAVYVGFRIKKGKRRN